MMNVKDVHEMIRKEYAEKGIEFPTWSEICGGLEVAPGMCPEMTERQAWVAAFIGAIDTSKMEIIEETEFATEIKGFQEKCKIASRVASYCIADMPK